MAKCPTSVSLTVDQRQQIEAARERRARGGEKPSLATIVREALDRGLPLVVEPPKAG